MDGGAEDEDEVLVVVGVEDGPPEESVLEDDAEEDEEGDGSEAWLEFDVGVGLGLDWAEDLGASESSSSSGAIILVVPSNALVNVPVVFKEEGALVDSELETINNEWILGGLES